MNDNTGLSRLLQKLLSDIKAPDFGPVFLGPKKFVNLFEQLTARAGIFIKHGGLSAVSSSLNGC